MDVLDTYAVEDDAFAVQWEFVEPLAFHCMFQPAGTPDRLTLFATNALHQALLTRDPTYPDRLAGEKLSKDGKLKPIGRTEAETRLAYLVGRWTKQVDFMNALRNIDSASYKERTRNFRNLASHAIAPRLGWDTQTSQDASSSPGRPRTHSERGTLLNGITMSRIPSAERRPSPCVKRSS